MKFLVNKLVIIGLFVISFVILFFMVPIPLGLEYCDVKFLESTFYEIQTKCWDTEYGL